MVTLCFIFTQKHDSIDVNISITDGRSKVLTWFKNESDKSATTLKPTAYYYLVVFLKPVFRWFIGLLEYDAAIWE